MDDAKRDEAVEAAILEYLRRKGYNRAGHHLEEESGVAPKPQLKQETDESLANTIIFYNPEENQPTRYSESYSALRDWGMSSLDMYRPELLSILFPVFVHCYLDLVEKNYGIEAMKFLQAHRGDHIKKHGTEIGRLESLTNANQMKENPFIQNFRQYKFHITMCRYAFELLLAFLHEKKFMLILSILNHYLNIEVHSGQPRPRDPDTILAPISGTEAEKDAEQAEFDHRLLPEQKRFYDKAVDPRDVLPSNDTEEDERVSKVPLPQLNQTTESQIFDDLRKKVRLDAQSKPSISLFTFFNSYDGIARSVVSSRGSMVAAAFSDSQIKLWDFSQDKNQGWHQMTQHYLDNDGRSSTYKPKKRETDSFNLIGHSGPVYGLTFSPDSQYLLSSSQDTTVRLWSMATKTNVVVYRGHTAPVWDVEFSPLGYYFATASHDKTARLWATNHSYPLRIFAGHLSDVNRVKFHPNHQYCATGSNDKCIRLWDITTGTCVRVFTGHYAPVYSLAMSPCGRFMASSGDDKDIILWDLATSKRITKLQGHTDTVWDLDFDVGGNVLSSGGHDNTVRLWDIKMVREEIFRTEQADKQEEKLRMELETAMEIENAEEANPNAPKRPKARLSVPGEQGSQDKLIGTYSTKRTPIYSVHFTNTNVLCCTGPYKRAPA